MGYLADILKKLDDEQSIIFVGVGIILRDNNGKILIGKRTDNKTWSLPGGSLEVGETLEEAAKRETFEETGIIINELELNWATTLKEPVIKNNREINIVSISYYSTDFDTEEFNMDSREFEIYDWLTLEEIEKLELTEYSEIAIEKFKKKHLRDF